MLSNEEKEKTIKEWNESHGTNFKTFDEYWRAYLETPRVKEKPKVHNKEEKLKALLKVEKLIKDGSDKIKQAYDIAKPYDNISIDGDDLDVALTTICRIWAGNQSLNVTGDFGIEKDVARVIQIINESRRIK